MRVNEEQKKIVFFDIEGDLDIPAPMWQLAAVTILFPTFDVVDKLEIKISVDESKCDPEALKISSYDIEEWKRSAISEADAVRQFSKFLQAHSDVTLLSKRGRNYRVARGAGHNAATYDIHKLRALYKRQQRSGEVYPPFLALSHTVLDTLQLAHWLFMIRPDMEAPKDFKLGTLCEYFKISLNAHDALDDVIATARLAAALSRALGAPSPGLF